MKALIDTKLTRGRRLASVALAIVAVLVVSGAAIATVPAGDGAAGGDVLGATFSVPAGLVRESGIPCAEGKQPLRGGVVLAEDMQLLLSEPQDGWWHVTVKNNGSSAQSFHAYAICMQQL